MPQGKEHILVIKHGALGDVVLSTAPFSAIREHHPNAHITLLTATPYHKMLADAPYFDEVWLDEKPQAWQVMKLARLIHQLRSRQWIMVYDLQTSGRSSRYFDLFQKPKPKFSGVASGCSHNCNTPHRGELHTLQRQQEQMSIAGINYEPKPDVSWLVSDVSGFELADKYALIIAGGSAHRPEKRWTKEGFAEFATWLIGQGVQPVLIGTVAEQEVLGWIEKEVESSSPVEGQEGGHSDQLVRPHGRRPFAVKAACHLNANKKLKNLLNQTSFADLAELGRNATLAIGNDTGPMHLVAASGCCPSIVLFSNASNPSLCAPRGDNVTIIQKDDLGDLTLAEVTNSAKPLIINR